VESTAEIRDARPDERKMLRDLHRRSSPVWEADRGEDVVARAVAAGDCEIAVTADPDALGFYERVGFVSGESVPTRFRPGVRMRRTLAPQTRGPAVA
jgi:hypothetical protein